MTAARLAAIGFIFVCTAVAWSVLGGTVVGRTGETDGRLSQEVAQLWGGRHVQVAPQAFVLRPRDVEEEVKEADARGGTVVRKVKRTVYDEVPLSAASSRVRVDLGLEHRRKGLLWYDTYTVAFEADYRLVNPDTVERGLLVRFAFPSKEATYDGFVVRLGGHEARPATDLTNGLTLIERVAPGSDLDLHVAYRSRGLGEWAYAFVKEGVAQVRDFQLVMTTDFDGFDFPAGTISPGARERTGAGWRLELGVREPRRGEAHRDRPSEPPQPRPGHRPHHLLRPCLPALLPDRDGDPGSPERTQPPPHELLLPGGRLLRLPPPPRLSRRPRGDEHRLRHFRRGQRLPGRELPSSRGRNARPPSSRPGSPSSSSSCSSATPSSSRATPGSRSRSERSSLSSPSCSSPRASTGEPSSRGDSPAAGRRVSSAA